MDRLMDVRVPDPVRGGDAFFLSAVLVQQVDIQGVYWMNAFLILDDGSVFPGIRFGAPQEVICEWSSVPA